jgi:prephenate dehydrogenase
MAIDLRRRKYADRILGMDADKVNAAAALKIGLVDEEVSEDELVERSDIIVVAVPVNYAVKVVCRVLDRFQKEGWIDKVVIDVCSTKEHIAEATMYHACRKQYVATHPMAGTEYSGPWAAKAGMFAGKVAILCDTEDSDVKAVNLVRSMYEAMYMRIIFMNSANHDVHTAYVSAISHISSFALALTVLDKEKNEKHIFDLASGGFDSTVRLAKSSAAMWQPIFEQNKDNVLIVLDTYIKYLQEFKKNLEDDNNEAVYNMIDEANRIRRVLK